MNVKQELQQINNKLDKSKHKLAAAKDRNDQLLIAQIERDIEKISKKITRLKSLQTHQVNDKSKDIKSLAFNRPITKLEQADMGKLKKSVRGLVVVHPLTALGKEMEIEVVTGFAPNKF